MQLAINFSSFNNLFNAGTPDGESKARDNVKSIKGRSILLMYATKGASCATPGRNVYQLQLSSKQNLSISDRRNTVIVNKLPLGQ
jgi:hypothetical protein